MPRTTPGKARRWPLALACVLALIVAPLAAEEHEQEHEGRARVALSPTYEKECGACHVAFAPALLPAASWRRLMAGLPNHFGVDASLDEASARELVTWLGAHAGRRWSASAAPPEDRITRSAWFQREHRRVSAGAWQRASIRSPSNCGACHAAAARGNFDDDAVRVPN